MRGHRSAVVGVVVVGCLVAGCSGQAGEHGGVPATTTGTSAVSTTAGAPTSTTATTTAQAPLTSAPHVDLPPAATAHTEDGAKAFVAFFVEQMGASAYQADASVIAALSGPNCHGCKTLIDYANELRSDHHHVDRQSVRLHGQIVYPNSTPDRYIIDALIEDQPSKVVDLRGTPVSSQAGEKFTLRNTVSWSAHGWIMSENLLVMN